MWVWGCTLDWVFVRILLGASCVEEFSIKRLDGWMDGRTGGNGHAGNGFSLLDTPRFFFPFSQFYSYLSNLQLPLPHLKSNKTPGMLMAVQAPKSTLLFFLNLMVGGGSALACVCMYVCVYV